MRLFRIILGAFLATLPILVIIIGAGISSGWLTALIVAVVPLLIVAITASGVWLIMNEISG